VPTVSLVVAGLGLAGRVGAGRSARVVVALLPTGPARVP